MRNRLTHRRNLRGGWTPGVVLLVLAVCTVGTGAGAAWWYFNGDDDRQVNILTHTIKPITFDLDVTGPGELESSDNTEVRCEVKAGKQGGGIAILRIVPEGTFVEEGDFLVQLDSSTMELERTQQQIVVNTSEALMIQARNTYETALIAKQEYIDGTFKQEQQIILSEIFLAEENLSRAQEYHTYSRRLANKGYITPLQLEADAFAVEKARNELETAKTKLRVIEEFTQAKMLKQLESDIATSKAKWEAEQNSYKLELDKLADLDEEIANCRIVAPTAGQVKYAHERDRRGNNDVVIEEGTQVRERQVIIRLPDVANMQVKLDVNESIVDRVREGMEATIRVVGIKDLVLPGKVLKVNEYSEPTSWRSANVKQYASYIRILRTDKRLRAGMTAEVTVHCMEIPEAITLPVQAIQAHGRDYYAFVQQQDGGWEHRKLELGPTNDQVVVIEDGVSVGDRVARDPRNYPMLVKSLPALSADELQQVVRKAERPEATEPAQPTGRPDPAQVASGIFERMDKNQDGVLEASEMPDASRFAAADANSDGRVDQAELTAAMQQAIADGSAPGENRPGESGSAPASPGQRRGTPAGAAE